MKSTAVVQRKTSLLHKDMLLLLVVGFFRLFEAFFKGSFQSTATLVFSSDTCSLNTIISNQVIFERKPLCFFISGAATSKSSFL